MKIEESQQTTQKYKDHRDYCQQLYDNKNGQVGRNGRILRKVQPSKTESGRNRNFEQNKHNHWNQNCDRKKVSPKAKAQGFTGKLYQIIFDRILSKNP